MKVLVTVASKHGSTREVGQIIAQELRDNGFDVDFLDPQQVESLDEYDGIILGSAVYMSQWMEGAREFVSRFATTLRIKPLWAFSVGLSGVGGGEVRDPSRVGPVLLSIQPRGYTNFKGKLDPAKLTWRERTIAKMGGASEGDYREIDTVKAWTQHIAAEMVHLSQD